MERDAYPRHNSPWLLPESITEKKNSASLLGTNFRSQLSESHLRPVLFKWFIKGGLLKQHQIWLEGLKEVSLSDRV